MKELKYQKEAIEEIVAFSTKYLTDDDYTSEKIIFKAPTGSGKTYMISQAMTQIVKKNKDLSISYIWISVNKLHEQSYNSLSRYFEDERLLDCKRHTEINNSILEENEIMFINWESINKENSLFRVDNEHNWNIQSVVERTKDEGRTIILLIDESHQTAGSEKSKELIEVIAPRLTIEITATPKASTGQLIEIKLPKVIREGMIKKEIRINDTKREQIKSNEDLLLMAIRTRNQLQTAYKSIKTDINPLLLIQVPNKRANDIVNPEDYIIEILSRPDINITKDNGKLAVWLSDEKTNKDDIELNSCPVEVLIFKEAIALGWDCPRASILYLQREWNTERFEFNIQTLGRIMRMPEQKHYEDKPELNIGYVFSASDNVTIVEELAKDYVSEQKLQRDDSIYDTISLRSEYLRRKRELRRFSGDFKYKFNEIAEKYNLKNTISKDIKGGLKTVIGLGGVLTDINKDGKQDVVFADKKSVEMNKYKLQKVYDDFLRSSVSPFEMTRSTTILKSAIRSWFKETLNIVEEDKIQLIVMSGSNNNNTKFRQVIEEAKDLYGQIEPKEDKIEVKEDWTIPEDISLFTDIEEIKPSKKSIMKNPDTETLFIKKDKSGRALSGSEKEFIDGLEKTDDYVQWWFKNDTNEPKYFSIVYTKSDGQHYCFYPDFIIRTKRETIIVETKADNDFQTTNYYKLLACKDYINRVGTDSNTRFYMLSPVDFSNFFVNLKNMELDKFNSIFENRLLRNLQEQQRRNKEKNESGVSLNKSDQEYNELFAEYEEALNKLNDEKLQREWAESKLAETQEEKERLQSNLNEIGKSRTAQNKTKIEANKVNIPKPFNICVLGEITDEAKARKELKKYFQKYGFGATDWDIEFVGNAKLKNTTALRSLVKEQTRFNIAIVGQIYSHTGKSNSSSNIVSELSKPKYIPSLLSGSVKDPLTVERLIEMLDEYIVKEFVLRD